MRDRFYIYIIGGDKNMGLVVAISELLLGMLIGVLLAILIITGFIVLGESALGVFVIITMVLVIGLYIINF